MEHHLRTWPVYFERVADGSKTFEVRKDDRGYQTGDVLVLHEWSPERCGQVNCRQPHDAKHGPCRGYSGRSLTFRVGFIFRQGFGADLGSHVVMSLVPQDPVR